MRLPLLLPGQLAMRVVGMAARPASRTEEASPPMERKSKGTMPPHRRQPGGALGRLDAHGAIRWMLKQYRLLILRPARRTPARRAHEGGGASLRIPRIP